jgi:alkylation response protein AidB-like acyl-CoA dehydrogenase
MFIIILPLFLWHLSRGTQDCAGAILYSSDRAVEVAIEAMQCLGGNGYINGKRITYARHPLARTSADTVCF